MRRGFKTSLPGVYQNLEVGKVEPDEGARVMVYHTRSRDPRRAFSQKIFKNRGCAVSSSKLTHHYTGTILRNLNPAEG